MSDLSAITSKPAPSMVTVVSSAENRQQLPAPASTIMESVLIRGDLAKLSPQERNTYYMETCRSLGLNPLTKPFEYIALNGKLRLYATRDCSDQLRKLNNISVEIVSREVDGDLLTVHVRACDATGRKDEDYGVLILGALRGEARANAIMKCVTKAKRRVTLSICGLGWPDETEVETIPGAKVVNGWPQGDLQQPGDYDDGVPEKYTKPKQEPERTRLLNAAVTFADRARAMQDELRQCASVVELLELGDEMKTRRDYQTLPDTLKDYIWKTQAKCLAKMPPPEVVHETDDMEPRPVRSDDFVEPPALEENGISARAMEHMRGRPSRHMGDEQ